MMKTLNRLLLVVLSVALLAAVWAMHSGMTQVHFTHETYYAIKWPWLRDVREVCLFCVLGWCVLFVRREPAFVRLGLVAIILAFAIMNIPPRLAKELPAFPLRH
jgi:hypothetical protein